MKPSHTTSQAEVSDSAKAESVLLGVLSRLLAPVARLCLAKGVTFAAVVEVLKRAFVQEAVALQPGAQGHGAVSRISTATGINRREVTLLTKAETLGRSTKPPLVTELFARWTTDPGYRDRNGAPRVLKRLGSAPSFEALAQAITRDRHPRSLLDELVRLGLARYDAENDCIALCRSDFVPSGDARQMLDFLGHNCGDHLDAAVANVLRDDRQHLEQAVFADELSAESVETLRPLVTTHWQALREAMVPVITALIEADRLAGRTGDRRVRVGVYSFNETTSGNESLAKEKDVRRNLKTVKGAPK